MSVRSISVSPAERRRAREFAELLEGSRVAAGHELEPLVALSATLLPEQFIPDIRPRAEFRASLRDSLIAEAAARRPAPGVAESREQPPARQHRIVKIVATGVLASLVGGVGVAAASTHALPGDALYGLKRDLESAQLRFDHSDLSRGRDLLDQANNRLSETEQLASSEDSRSPETTARIAATIADLDAATRAGADALNASYADTGNVEPLVELHRFVVNQQERLADLSTLLSPAQQALLSPISDLLLVLQVHAERVLEGTSALRGAPGATTSATPGSSGGPGLPGTIGDVTGGSTAGTGGAVGTGGIGDGGAATSVPTGAPHVSVPVPTKIVPSVSLPSVPLPSVSLPPLSVPTPSGAPTLPVHVSTPACIPIPPLTTC
jgi:Domain of unknown function (DUF5667)